MHGRVLEAPLIRENLVDVGVGVNGPLQQVLISVLQGKLKGLVGIALAVSGGQAN